MKKKYIAGGVVFFGIIMLAVLWWLISSAWQALPSKQDVVNFANDKIEEAPTVGEMLEGSLIPDSDPAPQNGETLVPTTLPTGSDTAAPSWLTPKQQKILSTLGVDVGELPTQMTPALETCLVGAIGQERFDAVMDGASPTVMDGIGAMKCL